MSPSQATLHAREPDLPGEAISGTEAWYACATRARHEKRVAERLLGRGVHAYLPVVPRLREWHDRKRIVRFPLFPGYVFVRASAAAAPGVASVPGAVSLVAFGGRPAPISEAEIANVRRLTAALSAPQVVAGFTPPAPIPEIAEGEPARVIAGPFQGVEGTVVHLRGRSRALLRAGVRSIGQEVHIEVDAASIRPL